MDKDFKKLIKEAAALKREFLTGRHGRSPERSLPCAHEKQQARVLPEHPYGEHSPPRASQAETGTGQPENISGPVLPFSPALKVAYQPSKAPLLLPQFTAGQTSEVSPDFKKTPAVLEAAAPGQPGIHPEREPREIKPEPVQAQFSRLDTVAREFYSRLLAATRSFITLADHPCTADYDTIIRLGNLAGEILKTNPVLLNYTAFSTADDYLYAHTANVTILSQAIALDLGLSQEDRQALFFCAMAHDRGMTGFKELYSKNERISDSEFSRVSSHVQAGITALNTLTDIDPGFRENIKVIISQVHERVDASGYPAGLAGKGIDLLAQIIGIADVYEAMTHPRSWREALHPHVVIRQFIERANPEFSPKLLRALIHILSIYPPSSLVELTNGEIARVLIPRKCSLTRPLVEILLDTDFYPVQNRIVDLSEHPVSDSIKRPVLPGELHVKNHEVASSLKLNRWWTDAIATTPAIHKDNT